MKPNSSSGYLHPTEFDDTCIQNKTHEKITTKVNRRFDFGTLAWTWVFHALKTHMLKKNEAKNKKR